MKLERILNAIFFSLGSLFLVFLLIKSENIRVSDINPNVIVAIIAGMVTMSGYFISRSFDRQKVIDQQLREQKLPAYNDFVKFVLDYLLNPEKEQDLVKFFGEFNQKSIVWLSDRSLKAYIEWAKLLKRQHNEGNNKEFPLLNLVLLEHLLMEFRADIGHKNENLEIGDILWLFINDLDEHDLNKYKALIKK